MIALFLRGWLMVSLVSLKNAVLLRWVAVQLKVWHLKEHQRLSGSGDSCKKTRQAVGCGRETNSGSAMAYFVTTRHGGLCQRISLRMSKCMVQLLKV